MTRLSGFFLQQGLCIKGFQPLWCEWVARFLKVGSLGIHVNDDIGHYLNFFNIAGDMLAIFIARAKEDVNTTPCGRWCFNSTIRWRYNIIYGT
jgi:hypothetical protein